MSLKDVCFVNAVEENDDYTNLFEKTLLYKLTFSQIVDIKTLKLFRGVGYFGFVCETRIILFDEREKTEKCFNIDSCDRIAFFQCTTQGNFGIYLTEGNVLSILHLPTLTELCRKRIEVSSGNTAEQLLIVDNGDLSEVWIFLRKSLIKFSNLNFPQMASAVSINDTNQIKEGFMKFDMKQVNLPFSGHTGLLLSVDWIYSKNKNEFLLCTLYSDYIVVHIGRFNNGNSSIIYSYYTKTDDIDVVVDRNASISFATDNVTVFILVKGEILWTWNYLAGFLSGYVKNENHVCLKYSIMRNAQLNSDIVLFFSINNLSLISFPKIEKIQDFNISKDCLIFPHTYNNSKVLFIETQSGNYFIKSITLIDPIQKLKEMINMKNYDEARKFAARNNLDNEEIYIDEMKFILSFWSSPESSNLSNERLDILLNCVTKLKKFFDKEIFQNLLLIPMTVYSSEESLLTSMKKQTELFLNLDDAKSLISIINQELEQLSMFGIIHQKQNFSPDKWIQFRNLNYLEMLYLAIDIQNSKGLVTAWQKLKDSVDDIFLQDQEKFLRKILDLCYTAVLNNKSEMELEAPFTWIAFEIIPKQIEKSPENLASLLKGIGELMMKIEINFGRKYRLISIGIISTFIRNLRNFALGAKTPTAFGNVMSSRLTSQIEHINPSSCLHRLLRDLERLEYLHKQYGLDLTMDIIRSEEWVRLASRILDQTDTSEINKPSGLDTLKSFLREFQISELEFFHTYIRKLINRIRRKSVDNIGGDYLSILNRFLQLIKLIVDKQLRLELLYSFLSNSDIPFNKSLLMLTTNEIQQNNEENPIVEQLRLLIRRSEMFPICSKYGFRWTESMSITQLLQSIFNADVDVRPQDLDAHLCFIKKQFNINDCLILESSCSVYFEKILFEDDLTAMDNFSKLQRIIKDDKLPNSVRNSILRKLLLMDLLNFVRYESEWEKEKLSFISEVALTFFSYLSDEFDRLRILRIFTTLRLCILDPLTPSNGNFIQTLQIFKTESSIMDLDQPIVICEIVEIYIYNLIKHQLSLNEPSSTIDGKLKQDIFHSIDKLKPMFSTELQMNLSELLSICQRVYIKLLQENVFPRLLMSIVEISFETFYKLGVLIDDFSQKIKSCIQILSLWLNKITTEDFLSSLCRIFKLLTSFMSLLDICCYQEVKYCLPDFRTVLALLRFVTSLCGSYSMVTDKFYRYELRYFYKEKPDKVSDEVYPLVRCCIETICSYLGPDFLDKVQTTYRTIFDSLPMFIQKKLLISGYFSGLSVLITSTVDEERKKIELLLSDRNLQKEIIRYWQYLLVKTQVDSVLITGLVMLCDPDEVEKAFKDCMKRIHKSRLLVACSISVFISVVFNRPDFIQVVTNRALMEYWVVKLGKLHIHLSRSLPMDKLGVFGRELIQNPRVSYDIVKEFHCSFGVFRPKLTPIECFKEIFKTDFDDCESFNAYLIKVESLLERAEFIWQQCPKTGAMLEKIESILTGIFDFVSPYHYEVLSYLYERLNACFSDYETEIKLLKIIRQLGRRSPVSETERRLFNRIFTLSENSFDKRYLVDRRLPFFGLMHDDSMPILAPEMSLSNVTTWFIIYNLLNDLKTVEKNKLNKDIIRRNTVDSIISNYFRDCNVGNQIKEPVFYGPLFEHSSAWFKSILNAVLLVLNEITVKHTFIDIMQVFLDRVVIVEQKIYAIELIIEWIDRVTIDQHCTSRSKLMSWQQELNCSLLWFRMMQVVHQNGLQVEWDLSDKWRTPERILHVIIENEALRLGDEKPVIERMASISKAVKQIASLSNIDLVEFSTEFIKTELRLEPGTGGLDDLSMDNDSMIDSSIGNISMNMSNAELSMEDSAKAIIDEETQTLMQCAVLLMYDADIRRDVTSRLFQFVSQNCLTLFQLNTFFRLLFYSFLPCEDSTVDNICNSRYYTTFLIFRQLATQNAVKYVSSTANSLKSIDEHLTSFSNDSKTNLIKYLYCGTADVSNCDATVVNNEDYFTDKKPIRRNFAIISNMVQLYGNSSIDMGDRQIRAIVRDISSDEKENR